MKKIIFIIIISTCTLKASAQKSIDEYKLMVDSAININYLKYQQFSKILVADYFESLYLINEQNLALDYLPLSKKFKTINILDKRNEKLVSRGICVWKVYTELDR